jgi:hypothetical protein
MASTRCVHSGIDCTASRIHQRDKKNSFPLKEVLTPEAGSWQRVICRDHAARAMTDARNAHPIVIGETQHCRKRLRRSYFRDSCFA